MAVVSRADRNDVLMLERTVDRNLILAFPNDDKITPKISDFEVINYVLMSNELGERWCVVTLKNNSSGNRIFENTQLMALFSDGNRKAPLHYKLSFKGRETQSITISFGVSKFPILTIYSSNDTQPDA